MDFERVFEDGSTTQRDNPGNNHYSSVKDKRSRARPSCAPFAWHHQMQRSTNLFRTGQPDLLTALILCSAEAIAMSCLRGPESVGDGSVPQSRSAAFRGREDDALTAGVGVARFAVEQECNATGRRYFCRAFHTLCWVDLTCRTNSDSSSQAKCFTSPCS